MPTIIGKHSTQPDTTNKSAKAWNAIFSTCLLSIAIWMAIICFAAIGAVSLFMTTVYPEGNEIVAYRFDTALPVGLFSFIVIVVVCLLQKYRCFDRVKLSTLIWALAFYLLIACMTWALLINVWPVFDSKDLITAATELGRNYNGAWSDGWYMERYPYQLPYVLLIRLLQNIFGSEQIYIVLEFVNAICASATGVLLVLYAKQAFSETAAKITGLLSFFFLPLVMFTTFVYGNIPSLPFTIAALFFQARYFDNRKFRYILFAAITVAISILLKSTMIITLLAMIVLWIIHAIHKKEWRDILAIVISCLIYLTCSHGLTAWTSQKYDVTLDNGLPKTVWIAMGLQQHSSPTNPGWYNGYPWNWQENYSPETAGRDAAKSIEQSLEHFMQDPQYAISFMARKQASIWLDPTYETILNSNWDVAGDTSMSGRPMTKFVSSIYHGKINVLITTICDVIQFLTLLGSVVAFFAIRKTKKYHSLGGMITCLGIVCIYIVWEAKAQYVFPAYTVLLAYAGYGISVFSQNAKPFFLRLMQKLQQRKHVQ